MNAKRRLAGFKALVEEYRNSDWYFEEVEGDRRLWKDFSPQGKLEYIARDAALYEVLFEAFADAARDFIGESALGDAALRMVLGDAREFRSLGAAASTRRADRIHAAERTLQRNPPSIGGA